MNSRTGWPPGLLQDDCRKLSEWFETRIDARHALRKVCAQIKEQHMTTDQNPIKKPDALRLADALRDGTYLLSVERMATARALSTQHALLERARAALSHSNPSEPIWKTPHRETLAALNQHLEPK